MALFGEDFDLAFGDLNSSLLPSENAVFNFSMKEAYEILAKEHRILDTYFANILIVVYVILVAMGLFSNTMVWLVVARRAQMRTPRNFYVVNLTVSDISLCLISMPFTLINFIQMQWKLGEAMCKLVPVVQGTNIFVGTGTVMAIALDRYFTIVRSKGAPQDSTRVLLSIALIWIVSCLFTLPIIFYQVLEEESIGGYIVASHCIEKWPTSSMRAAYTVGILVFQLLIPILVLAVVHVAIANHLNAHRLSTNNGSKEGAGGGGGSTGRNGSLKGSTLKKISKSSIFRIQSKKKHQHMILDESHAVGVPGKRTILNGNDNALYNISSDDACKFLPPPSTTMAIETGVGVGGKQNSARVTDYEQQTSNGFPLNGSNANATTAATTTEGNPMEIASPTATSTVLEPDSLAISLRTGNSITTGERGKNDRRDLEGRHSFGETNTNLPNPFQVKFKSNIGVCITFREFCQLSDGKTNNNGHKKRIELANHNNVSSSSSPSKIQESCCAAVEVERKLSHNGCQSLEASPDKTCARTSPTIGNEKHDSAFLVGPITDEVKLNGGAAQPNGNSTTIAMPVAPTAFAPSPSGNKNGSASSKRTKKELARNKRTTIILLLVSVIFTVSWLPWHLLTLWADLYPNFTSTSNLYMLYAVSHIIAMSSAVTNAVLYGWLNTNLRRELTQMISGWCKRG